MNEYTFDLQRIFFGDLPLLFLKAANQNWDQADIVDRFVLRGDQFFTIFTRYFVLHGYRNELRENEF